VAHTNPFSAPSISGYNTSPPPDGGEQTAANEITWAKHKDKLADPIKTLIETAITNITTMGTKVINTDADENNAMAGSLAFTSSELTIATGAITPTRSHHTVDTQDDDATDDLDTINTGSVTDGCETTLRAANTGRTVVLKHSTDNILMADDADFSLDDDEKSIRLQLRGSNWHELTRSDGLPAASQAQMEAASVTNFAVTPGRQHFHPGTAKAWIRFTPAGANEGSYGVSSLDDDGTGDWGANFTTAFTSATTYQGQLSWLGASTMRILFNFFDALNTGSAEMSAAKTADGAADETGITSMLAVFWGDH